MTMTRLWNVIGAVTALLVLVLGYAVGVSPALTSAANSDEEIANVELQNQVKATELAALKALAENSDQLFADLEAVQLAVPSTHETSIFARQIENLAKAAGVTITDVAYQAVVDAIAPEGGTVPPASPDAEGDAATEGEAPAGPQAVSSVPGLVSVGISIRVKGPYANVTKFLNNLQLNQRSFSVTTADLRVAGDAGDFELSLVGSVYVLAGNAAPITAPTPAPATDGEVEG